MATIRSTAAASRYDVIDAQRRARTVSWASTAPSAASQVAVAPPQILTQDEFKKAAKLFISDDGHSARYQPAADLSDARRGKYGLRTAVIRTVGATGGVMTSAGLIFAASMLAITVSSFLTTAQMGFFIGVGLLLDTFIVRTLTVPAMAVLVGDKNWWPSKPPRVKYEQAKRAARAAAAEAPVALLERDDDAETEEMPEEPAEGESDEQADADTPEDEK